jgi:outer membrane protein OmpA-like peptidoglycan-associated protein
MIQNTLRLMAISTLLTVVACSSTDKKIEEPVKPVVVEPPKKEEAPVLASRSVDTRSNVDAQNEKLAKVPVMGLPPFEAGKKIAAYGKDSLAAAKAAVADMPEGYVLQITGHHNQHPDKAQRKGNGLSKQRAKQVYDYFVKNGIAKEKLSYRGVGSSEYDNSLSREKNRRVTFMIVKAGGEEETPAALKPKPELKPEPKSEVKPEAPAEAKP